MTARTIAFLAVFATALPGCGNGTGPQYHPDIPTGWVDAVTNPFFPLVPGTTYAYQSQSETDTVVVTAGTRVVSGVTATIVWDRVFQGSEMIEETYDWFAQDSAGNVWYLGEDSREYQNGQLVTTEGSWEWGVNGALPGVIMWDDPAAHVGEPYRQEFRRGVAEDWGKVIALDQSVTVPYGTLTGCLETEDWSGLSSEREHKFYCPQVGNVLEQGVHGNGREELTALTTP